jgi:hypothetical protein
MAFKVTYVPNNKADEIIDAEAYEEKGWFVFTRFTPNDYMGRADRSGRSYPESGC